MQPATDWWLNVARASLDLRRFGRPSDRSDSLTGFTVQRWMVLAIAGAVAEFGGWSFR